MKTLLWIGIFASLFFACGAPSAAIVNEQPTAPVVIVRPAEPYERAVWIGDDWRWRNGNYVYVKPHYVKSKRNMVWIDGHWEKRPNGYVWVQGHWQ